MIISVRGGSKRQKELVKSMVYYCQKELMPKLWRIEVNIHIKDFGKDNTLGYALPDQDADLHRPRAFDIELNKKMRLRRLLETVAHEMVHVKQFARGELYESTTQNKHRWQGQWLSNHRKCVKDYWQQPWEIEAHGRELGLFIGWCSENACSEKHWVQDPLGIK
jgi:hypothetical protein|tara:strand:- start:42 stop:533 length:492 start_codon:yes stop_codon:yes gene_type:complete